MHSYYYNLSDLPVDVVTRNDNNTSIEWIHVADASLRIEAIISGQAVIMTNYQDTTDNSNMTATHLTQTVAVQPPPSPGLRVHDNQTIIPIPHTVVVIKQNPPRSPSLRSTAAAGTKCNNRPESRSRRVGRLSRQFIGGRCTQMSDEEEESSLCPYTMNVLTSCCGLYSQPSPMRVGQPVLC